MDSFENGEVAGIPRQLLRAAFGPHLAENEPELWRLRYDDINSCVVYLTADPNDPGMITGFMVHRPCVDQRLWDALATVLALGNVVLYFPGGRASLVGRGSVTGHLPPDLVESLGQPVVVTSGREIQDEIDAA